MRSWAAILIPDSFSGRVNDSSIYSECLNGQNLRFSTFFLVYSDCGWRRKEEVEKEASGGHVEWESSATEADRVRDDDSLDEAGRAADGETCW